MVRSTRDERWRCGAAAERWQRPTARIIVVFVALVVGTTTIVRFVGNRRVTHEVARIRQRASTVRVEPASLLSSAFGGGTDPIAAALDTDATTSEIKGLDSSWCATLEVQRLLSKRSVYFMISASGQLVETAGNPFVT
jgi:hypothetical protein